MKNFIFALVVVVAVGATSVANAAMPNFVGVGYKQPAQCVQFVDHDIYETVDGFPTLTGCIEGAAYQQSQIDARALQDTGFHFDAGEYVTLLSGATAQCPTWYNMGCVIDHLLIR